MTRLLHALVALYVLAIGTLIYCAHTSYEHGSLLYTGLFLALAVLFGCATGAHYFLADELRAAQVRLELRARPPDRRPAIDDAVAIELAAACCELWWTSAGADHDRQCARKDQTT